MKLRLSTVRLHLPLLAILLMLFSNAEAQQKKSQAKTAQKVVQKPVKDPYLGNLVKADYKYYFTGFYNKIYWDYVAPNNTAYRPVIDVRTFKPLNVWFQSAEPGRLMPDSTILQVIHDPYESTGRVLQMTPAGSMRYFTFGMIKMGEDSYNVNLSPDSKSGVFFKNNDIWSADFDYKSGKFANPRQVTKLGIFKPEVIWNWHANSIAVGNYLVNLVSGETIDLNENFLFNAVDYLKWSPDYRNYISPGDRWVKFLGKEFIQLFDFLNFKFVDLQIAPRFSSILWWVSDHEFLMNYQANGANNEDETKVVLLVDPTDLKNKRRIRNINDIMAPFSYNSYRYEIHPSPNRKYFLFYDRIGKNNIYDIYSLNLATFEKKKLDFLQPATPSLTFKQAVHWVDDTRIIFSQYSGQVTVGSQGTYLLDIVSGKKTKLTPYTLPTDYRLHPVVSLVEINTLLFNANGFLFKCNLDGSALEQVTKEPNEITLTEAFTKTFR